MYIIDALFSDHQGNLTQKWHRTFPSIDAAEEEFDVLGQRNDCIAAALTEWQPGSQGGELIHGSYGSRSCAGGVPKQIVLKHADRTFRPLSPYRNCMGAFPGSYIALDDWTVTEKPTEITTQPSPGFKLGPRKLTKREKYLLGLPEGKPVYEGLYATSWIENGSRHRMTMPESDIAKYDSREEFKAELISYSQEEKELLAKVAQAWEGK